jgi:hypothetical protein
MIACVLIAERAATQLIKSVHFRRLRKDDIEYQDQPTDVYPNKSYCAAHKGKWL